MCCTANSYAVRECSIAATLQFVALDGVEMVAGQHTMGQGVWLPTFKGMGMLCCHDDIISLTKATNPYALVDRSCTVIGSSELTRVHMVGAGLGCDVPVATHIHGHRMQDF